MLTLVIAAILSAQPTYQDPAASEVVNLRFAWPTTGSVRVREELLRKGNRATLNYELSWQPESDDRVVLTHEQVRLAMLNRDMSNPKIRQAVREAQAIATVVPQLHVSSAGALVSFEPIAAAIERTASALRKEVEEDLVRQMHEFLARPNKGALLEAKLTEVWGYWVGDWAGMQVARGLQAQLPVDREKTGGVIAQISVQVTDRTHFRGVPCVEILRTSTANEAPMKAKLVAMMRAQGAKSADLAARIERVDGEWFVRGIFSTDGLRPLEVHTSRSKLIWFTRQKEPVEEREDHSYFFSWGDLGPEEADTEESGD